MTKALSRLPQYISVHGHATRAFSSPVHTARLRTRRPFRSTPYSGCRGAQQRKTAQCEQQRWYRARSDIDIYPSTHTDPTSHLCPLYRTPHPAGRLSSVHERDRDRRKRCRATLLPPLPRGQPVRYDQDNVLSASLAPYLFTKNGPLTCSSITFAPLETTCKNSHHAWGAITG